LLSRKDHRLTKEGIIIIKAQRYRSQEKNRADALLRLQALLAKAAEPEKPRKRTRPTKSSQLKRREEKLKRSEVKALRGKIET